MNRMKRDKKEKDKVKIETLNIIKDIQEKFLSKQKSRN